ncbi:MAG TPA: hypothetical protein VGO97_03610 [Solirubrobacterales bacterium]|jgi:uncharacterized protein YxjI|nr:hypothetical protein [Solirubrobacterales bacterium]
MVNPHEHDRFVLRQKFAMVINRYFFSLPEQEDQPFCFVEQKRMKLKEDIRFYTDQAKTEELMRIKARQMFDPRARYDVTTATGEPIGQIQKVFGASLFRSTYSLFDAQGNETARVQERSLPVAIIRRTIGFIPFVGGFAEWIPIPYDFEFKRGEQLLGTHSRRRWKITDTYDIDLTPDSARTLDRRLVLALAVAMDALQAR